METRTLKKIFIKFLQHFELDFHTAAKNITFLTRLTHSPNTFKVLIKKAQRKWQNFKAHDFKGTYITIL